MLGRYEESRRNHELALKIFEQSMPADHPMVATGLDNLGSALQGLERYEEARPLHERAVPIWEKLGDGHPDLAISLKDLARALIGLERHRDAVVALERSVSIFNSLEIDPAERGQARFLLAQSLVRSGGDPARATELARQARADYQEAGDKSREQLSAVDAWLAER